MPKHKTKMSAVILAGGNSIRMGENKAFLQIHGVPIITGIYTLLKELFEEIIIVTNQKDLFRDFDSRIYGDLIPNKGALGGLYTGIFFSSFQYAFCVACDMPFLKRALIEFLVSKVIDEDAIVPRTADGLQPLHAIYSKNCLEAMSKIIEQNKQRIIDFYDFVKVKLIDEKEFLHLDPRRESFINVNTPEELLVVRTVQESQRR